MPSTEITLKRYLPTGQTRAIWSDTQGARERKAGVIPQRASRIEVITEGPQRGKFHVDFSLLAEATGDDRFRVCLPKTYESYAAANRAEITWLANNWVLA